MSGKEKGPLTELQQEVINTLKGIEEVREFYFTGGTALSAYYLHHRVSEDMDFFTPIEDLIQIDKTRNVEGMMVDSLLDIATGKLLALFGRAAERDFVDIYFLVKEGYYSLDELTGC